MQYSAWIRIFKLLDTRQRGRGADMRIATGISSSERLARAAIANAPAVILLNVASRGLIPLRLNQVGLFVAVNRVLP